MKVIRQKHTITIWSDSGSDWQASLLDEQIKLFIEGLRMHRKLAHQKNTMTTHIKKEYQEER